MLLFQCGTPRRWLDLGDLWVALKGLGLYEDSGKENGNYYLGLRLEDPKSR